MESNRRRALRTQPRTKQASHCMLAPRLGKTGQPTQRNRAVGGLPRRVLRGQRDERLRSCGRGEGLVSGSIGRHCLSRRTGRQNSHLTHVGSRAAGAHHTLVPRPWRDLGMRVVGQRAAVAWTLRRDDPSFSSLDRDALNLLSLQAVAWLRLVESWTCFPPSIWLDIRSASLFVLSACFSPCFWVLYV